MSSMDSEDDGKTGGGGVAGAAGGTAGASHARAKVLLNDLVDRDGGLSGLPDAYYSELYGVSPRRIAQLRAHFVSATEGTGGSATDAIDIDAEFQAMRLANMAQEQSQQA